MEDLFGANRPSADPGQATRVKICGITNKADADAAIELGADALGFNTSPASKRFIDVHSEEAWIRGLAPFATKVAVTVNSTVAQIDDLLSLGLFDIIQLHGSEDAAFCRVLAGRGISFIKAIALGPDSAVEGVDGFGAAAILLDTYTPRGFGGTGELIDLDAVSAFAAGHRDIRLVVSGGLRPGNVSEVVRRLRPYAVDVASGVEIEPRRKDRKLLSNFIEAVRSAK